MRQRKCVFHHEIHQGCEPPCPASLFNILGRRHHECPAARRHVMTRLNTHKIFPQFSFDHTFWRISIGAGPRCAFTIQNLCFKKLLSVRSAQKPPAASLRPDSRAFSIRSREAVASASATRHAIPSPTAASPPRTRGDETVPRPSEGLHRERAAVNVATCAGGGALDTRLAVLHVSS